MGLRFLAVLCWYLPILNIQSIKGDSSASFHLRVAGYDTPPSMIMTKDVNGNLTYSGVDRDIVDEMCRRLHWTYSYVNVVETGGMVKSLIQQVENNEVDISTYGFVATPDRVAIMDFSNVVEIDYFRFLLRYPDTKSRLLGPVRPFQPTVWELFLATLITVTMFATLIMICNQKMGIEVNGSGRTWLDYFGSNAIYVITIITSQGEYLPNKKLSVRMLAGIWCLMTVVLINSYTGNLTSYLSIPKLNPIPNSFDELAASSDYKLSIQANTVIMKSVLAATTGPYKVLGDFLRNNPNYKISKFSELFDYTLHRSSAHPEVSLVVKFALGLDMKTSGKCRLTVSKELPVSLSTGYILPKHSVIKSAIDSQLQRFWEYGILEKIRRNYRPRIDKCLIRPVKPKMAVLSLVDLSSAYLILGIGLGTAILVFFFENIHRIFQTKSF